MRENLSPGGAVSSKGPTQLDPLQLVSRQVGLGAITMYRSDVEGLAERLTSHIPNSDAPVIEAEFGDTKITQYKSDFLSRNDIPDRLDNITIRLTEKTSGIQRLINVTLTKDGNSNLHVQSDDTTWTIGTTVDLESFLRDRASFGTNFLRKHGLTLNAFIFLTAIAFLPDLEFGNRLPFIGVVVLLLYTLLSG